MQRILTKRATPTTTRRRALALAAAGVLAPRAGRAQDLTVVEAAGVPEDGITPGLWAVQAGLFRKRGLDVRIVPQRSGSATVAGVVGGAYQIGKGSFMSLLGAHVHGVPIVVIFPAGIYRATNPHSGIIVKTDSPIRTGADLDGKTMAVAALNDLFTLGADAWVDQHGGDSSTLKLVELPIGAVFEAVVSGRVDAGNTIDPNLRAALQTKRVRFLADTNAAIAPEFVETAWFTTTSYLRTNPQIVQTFRDVLHEASLYAQTHHAQTVDAFARFSGMDPAVVARMARQIFGTALDPRLFQPVIDAAAKYKVIPARFDARDILG